MIFGPRAPHEALGCVLAHSLDVPGGRLRKGTRLTEADLDRLAQGGHAQIVVCEAEPGDVPENEAAAAVADALLGEGIETRAPFTGRCNLYATAPGVLEVSRMRIDTLNRLTDDVTVATLPEWQRVSAGTMVATVKIISFFADAGAYGPGLAQAAGALRLHRPVLTRADLIVTELPGAPDKISAVTGRLDRLGIAYRVIRCAHRGEAVRDALEGGDAPLRLILTASATSDRRDVGPDGLVRAGGTLTRVGMPVDPGNLLFLGHLGAAQVIGLPGCARSPALNGADWVLERIACGIPVTHGDIAGMGVGGLLGEIPTRPQPRERG